MNSTLNRSGLADKIIFGLASLLALTTFTAQAVDRTWGAGSAGAGNRDFSGATNWTGNIVPVGTDNAILVNGNTVAITTSQTVNDIRAGDTGTANSAYNQTAGTVTLNGWFRLGLSSGSTGNYTISAGTLAVAPASSQLSVGEGAGGTGILTVSGGTLFKGGSGGTFWVGKAGTGTVNLSGTGTINATNNTQIGDRATATTATGTFNQSGGTNNCFGELWVGNGTGGTAGNVGTYNLSGGVLNANNWLAIGRNVAQGLFTMTGGTFNKNAGGNLTLAGIGTTQTGTLTQSGGALTNTATETWIGETAIGIYNLSSTAVARLGLLRLGLNTGANGTVNLDGGTLTINSMNNGTGSGTFNFNGGTLTAGIATNAFMTGLTAANVKAGGAIIDDGGFAITIAQALLASGGGLTKKGIGTLTLSGANTFGGITRITAGSLSLTNSIALQNTTVDLNGADTGLLTFVSPVTAATLGGLTGSRNLLLANSAVAAVALSIGNNNGSTNYTGILSGAGSLTKIGTGTATLGGVNTFTGDVNVSVGSLVISNSSGLGVGPKTIFVNNGTAGLDQLHLNGSVAPITLAANLAFQTSNGNVPGAIVNDAGNNIISGPITMTVGGGNTLVTVTSGTLQLAGNITPNTGTRTLVLDGAGNGTVGGQILDGGFAPGLTKTGAGTWTLNAANTYTGSTTVSNGTLALGALGSIANSTNIAVSAGATFNVSAASGYTLNAGQLLGGNGWVVGNVATATGAKISPGASAGTLTFSNNLALAAGETNVFELSGTTNGANDLIVVAGNLSLGGTNTILITPTAGSLANGRYKLIQYAGTLTGGATNFAVAFAVVPPRVATVVDVSVAGEIDLVVTASPATLVWQGDGTLNKWDAGVSVNWLNGGSPDVFVTGDQVTFDNSSSNQAVALIGTLIPASLNITTSSNYTFAGTGKIGGVAGLTKTGSGTLTVLTTNDYTGPTTITGSTLVVSNLAANGSSSAIGAGTSVVLDGGTLNYKGGNLAVGSFSRQFTLNAGGGTIDQSGSTGLMSITNTISGAGSLTKAGTNQLVLGQIVGGVQVGGNNSYAGDTLINQGEVQIRNINALGTTAGKTVVASGADLATGDTLAGTVPENIDLNGNGPGNSGALQANDTSAATLAGNVNLVTDTSIGGTATLTITGPLAGAGGLTKVGAGTLIIGGTNTYAGPTIINGGIFQVGNGGAGTTYGVGPLTNNNGTLAFNRSDDFVWATDVPGTNGGFLKLGTNTITLATNNSYLRTGAGAIQVNGGTLAINPAVTLLGGGEFWVAQNASTGACVINGGTLIVSNWIAVGRASTSAVGSMTMNGGLIQKNGGGNIIMGSLGGNGTLTVNGGTITNNSAILLGESATGVGTFNLNGGLVQATQLAKFGGLSAFAKFNGGTLQAVAANTAFISGLNSALVQSNGFTVDDAGFGITIASALTEDGSSPGGGFTKLGAGTNTMSVAGNTWSGDTTISNGTLRMAAVNVIPNGAGKGNVIIPSGSTLDLNTNSTTINGLTGAGTVNNSVAGAATLTVGNNNVSSAFNGVIKNTAGTLGLTKIGTGLLTLTAPNTFSGNTFVRAGTLLLNGGSISVLNFSSIGQFGTDNGTLTIQGSGAFATTSDLNMGDIDSSVGTLNLSDTANVTAAAMFVASANNGGSTANGTVNQTNGTVTTTFGGDPGLCIGGRNGGSAFGVGNYNLYAGTLNVNNGGNAWIGGYGNGTLKQSGGTVTLSGFVSVGRFGGGVGNLIVSGGSCSQTNPATFILIGEGGNGTLTVSNTGVVVVKGGLGLRLANGAGSVGTVNLGNGTLGGTIVAPTVSMGVGTTATFNFNGGTLKANNNSAAFMAGLTTANVQAGGAIIDDGGFAITIGQALLNGGGGLTKIGAGTLTLSNLNTYSGNTTISNGTLALSGSGSISSSPNIIVSGGTALDVSGETSTFTLGSSQTLVGFAATGKIIGNVNVGGAVRWR